ncbi:hypothetical protein [Microbacterium maritypicum]|uniref:hypothetical protein n=1 Tax=Microbacterium maritypicum TaxID=33918 RepID=UPI003A8CE241
MGNTFWVSERRSGEYVKMSNGLTNVFISTFGLAATRLAGTDGERRITYWVLEHDQSARGIGTVGFTLAEAPFDPASFDTGREFLLRATAAIMDRSGWETLNYAPNVDILGRAVEEFTGLVQRVTPMDLDTAAMREWLAASGPDEPQFHGFPTCPQHRVFLTDFGCHPCNDGQWSRDTS